MSTASYVANGPQSGSRWSACLRILTGVCMILFVASGCASVTPPAAQGPTPSVTTVSGSPSHGWFAARFKMKWVPGSSPLWHLDDLTAYEVISPTLEKHRDQIVLWRFHRRAAPDAAGHQFSFIFYATPKHAEAIYASIRSSAVLASLKSRGYLLNDVYADTSRIEQPNIEDTADPKWSLPLKRSWPNFIMGVSEAWLLLISQYAGERDRTGMAASVESLVGSYEKVHNAVEKTWQDEGGHALLHHLNAIFGYVPVGVSTDGHLMRF
ncbi:MAG: hypothetical protein AB9873_03975 [Syntrophobacteraceae bacterium]